MIVESPDGHCSETDDMTDTKGLIFDIKKYAIHDGPGIRTTVFLKGCPLECWWCHNPESRSRVPQSRKKLRPQKAMPLFADTPQLVGVRVSTGAVMEEIRKDVLFYDQSGGGVTLSGGEPLLQADFLKSLLKICRHENIHTAVDTSGYVDFNAFEKILDFTDVFLYDVKLIEDALHRKYTGVSNRLILENLVKLQEKNVALRVRIPLIPAITDTESNLNAIISFLKNETQYKEIDLLPFNQMGESKYERLEVECRTGSLKMQSAEEIEEIRMLFRNEGFRVSA